MVLGAFFREWEARAESDRRSLRRAALLLDELGVATDARPVLAVVGSKGKGSAATYASAHLEAAGITTVTVTSPGLRHRRDRIRHRGQSIEHGELVSLATRLQTARDRLPPPDDGYLSPSGLFVIAGALYAQEHNADVLVLEAGMGGRGDEVSLFGPTVVAMTVVFAEHIGVLGDTVGDIAHEKAAVAGPRTRAFVRLPLPSDLADIVRRTVTERTDGQTTPEVVRPFSSGLPRSVLPAGLPRFAAELGSVAADRLLRVTCRPRPSTERLRAVLSSTRLLGRLSHHAVPGSRTKLIVDSAIDRTGISAALAYAAQQWPTVDHVVACLPDHKDVAGAVAELAGLPVTMVTLADRRLTFTATVPPDWGRQPGDAITRDFLAGLGEHVVVLGTVYFTARVLDTVGADTERLFDA